MKAHKLVFTLLALCVASPLFAGARFASIQGAVQIFENGKWVKATLASKINTGTSIETGPKSSAVVIFSRGGQMALQSHTRITINDADSPVGGTDREMNLAQGEVSGFVKKDLKAPNAFRMRTPTVIAGVRGSLLTARLQGNKFVATAQKSAAYVKPAPKATVLDNKTKALQSAVAMKTRITAQVSDAKKILARAAAAPSAAQVADAKKLVQQVAAQKAALFKAQSQLLKDKQNAQRALARARTPEQKAAARKQLQEIVVQSAKLASQQLALSKQAAKSNSIVAAAKSAPTARQIASANAAIKAGEKNLAALNKSIANMQKDKAAFEVKLAKQATDAKVTDSGPVVELAQGQTIVANGDKLIDPMTVVRISVRPEAAKNVGVTAQEATFMRQNDDSKIGIGNDFQQIYNQINSVTQPASGGLPELSKF